MYVWIGDVDDQAAVSGQMRLNTCETLHVFLDSQQVEQGIARRTSPCTNVTRVSSLDLASSR